MNEPIKNIKLSFTCSENWDAMPQANGGRHCDKCQKKVHDFTKSKADEFRKVLAENNYNVCGRFSLEQMAPITYYTPALEKVDIGCCYAINWSKFI
jgi:hypothetical protein